MNEYESLSHTTWDCKYHVVFIPKCRRKTLYQELRRHLGEVFRKLALQKDSKVEEGHLMPDHVHMLLSIPPKYAVSQVVGFIKGKSAIHGQGLWRAQAQFRRTTLLGPRLFREHGRARRGGDPRLHPQSRERRSEAGADEPLALIMPPSGGAKFKGPRQRPLLPLRAVHVLKPPALPGDTYSPGKQSNAYGVARAIAKSDDVVVYVSPGGYGLIH
jgi:REP element-mobilizing transposase RayT